MLRLARFALLSSALLALASCSSEAPVARGQLMVVVRSNMALPDDVDTLRVQVLTYGSLQHDGVYKVPGDVLVPATLNLVAGDDPARPVTIRVLAMRAGNARLLREVVTTVPASRVAQLPISIDWLCDGTAEVTSSGARSTCGEGKSCVAGECRPNLTDSSLLPDHDDRSVWGGELDPAAGRCFDTVGCMARGALADVDVGDCSVASPGDPSAVNVALMPKSRAGICDDAQCFVPLDRSDEGWRQVSGRLALPPRVCQLAQAGDIVVAVSTACETKLPAYPPCGPWTAVGKGGRSLAASGGAPSVLVSADTWARGGMGGEAGGGGLSGMGGSGQGGAGQGGAGQGGAGKGGAGQAGAGGLSGMAGAAGQGGGTGLSGMGGSAGQAGAGGKAGAGGQGPVCGDGVRQGDELCDGVDLGGATCGSVVGGTEGALSCRANCTFDTAGCSAPPGCGDGIKQTEEQCDGSDLANQTCVSVLGVESFGALSCLPNCTISTAGCRYCGDGVMTDNEQCDGVDLGGQSCSSIIDGATGVLGCTAACGFDVSGCKAAETCGDWVKNGNEACDGPDLAGAFCDTVVGPGSQGTITCSPTCTFDTSGCSVPGNCGDGVKQAGEQCDGVDLGGADCAAATGIPTAFGSLACAQGCLFDMSACVKCGDGVMAAGEQCDGADLGGLTCDAVASGTSGQLGCTSACLLDTSLCAPCGDGLKGGLEACDGGDLGGASCASTVGGTGTVACTGLCKLDVSGCSACTDGGTEYSASADPCGDCHAAEQGPGGCCEAQTSACDQNPDCVALSNCLSGCGADAACKDACVNQLPNGVASYQAWELCVRGDGGNLWGACGHCNW